MIKQAQNRIFVSESLHQSPAAATPSAANFYSSSAANSPSTASSNPLSKQRVFLGHTGTGASYTTTPVSRHTHSHYHTAPFTSPARPSHNSAPPATPIIANDIPVSTDRTVASAISQPPARPTPSSPPSTNFSSTASSISQRERESMTSSSIDAVTPTEAFVSMTPAQLAKRQMQAQPWNNVLNKLSSPLRSTSKAHTPDETLHSEYVNSMKKKSAGGA